MHTASLFPGRRSSPRLWPPTRPIVAVRPPNQPEARLTLSAPVLRGSGVIHLLITGEDKLAALDKACRARSGRGGAGARSSTRRAP